MQAKQGCVTPGYFDRRSTCMRVWQIIFFSACKCIRFVSMEISRNSIQMHVLSAHYWTLNVIFINKAYVRLRVTVGTVTRSLFRLCLCLQHAICGCLRELGGGGIASQCVTGVMSTLVVSTADAVHFNPPQIVGVDQYFLYPSMSTLFTWPF